MTAHIVVIGAGAAGRKIGDELLAAGVTDFVILDKAPLEHAHDWPAALAERLRPGHDVIGSVFDDDTDTWTLKTRAGKTFRCPMVIATHRPLFAPWIPDLAGRNDFRGMSFHAADWDPKFDPAGKRIAVVGTDATAGYYLGYLGRLPESAASVTVFPHAPRRVVTYVSAWVPLRAIPALRWLRRNTRPARGWSVVESAIDALTRDGIRTNDGVEHRVDAIIYGTGFQIAAPVTDETLVGTDGLTIRQAWRDGMEPHLGIAVHGFPNYFLITGPDIPNIDVQTRYIVECVGRLQSTGKTRIEVLRSSQQVFNERAHLGPAQLHRAVKAFDLTSGAAENEQTYDGAATLTLAGACHSVRVRLAGHLDPIDGQYHWQGTVLSSLPDDALKSRAATLTVGERSAPARLVEQTPTGTHSIAGVGAPPYPLVRS